MAYDSPFSGAYGGAGPALPPGFMEMATQPGRDMQKVLKSIGEKFKERREKKKQAAKELKATRSLAKALGVDRIGMDEESIETADVDTIMGKIQGWQAKNKERELAVKEAPGKQDRASMQMIQQALGSEAEGLATRREAPFVARGGPLDEQGEARLQGLQNLLPAIEQNLGAHPEMVETIMALSQGGGSGAGSIRPGPLGSLLLQNSKNAFSVLKGVDEPPSQLEVERAGYYRAQAEKAESGTEANVLYNEMLRGIQGDIDTSEMDKTTKKEVTDLEDEIKLAQDNLKKITQLGNATPFVNYDSGVINLKKSRAQQGDETFQWGVKSKGDAKLEEEQKLEALQKKLNKLRGDSGGAAVPRPPLGFDDSPENLFAE